MVQCTRIACPFIRKFHAIHCHCQKCWNSGIIHWQWVHAICYQWFILFSFEFLTIHFQMASLPTVKTAAVFSGVFGWLFRPTWFTWCCFDCQRLRLRGWCMCHGCTWLCCCHRCLQLFFNYAQFLKQTLRCSLVVIKQFPDIANLLVLRFCVAKICPCSSSIHMSRDPCQCSSVFMSENSFSTLVT